jgi:hypothetical protein
MSVLPNPSSPDSSPIKRRKPWKEIGYRGFSAFLASDNDFLVFRRFGAINARLLLYLQDEIAVLEQDLEHLEVLHSQDSAVDIHNGSFRQETLPQRKKLLDTLLAKVKEYSKLKLTKLRTHAILTPTPDDLLIQNSTLRTHPRAPKRNTQSISNWLSNEENAILPSEAAYISKTHDLVQLVPKAVTPLRKLLEKSTRFRLARFWEKTPPNLPTHSSAHPDAVHYSSDTRIERAIGIAITLVGMGMLIAPLWVLAHTDGMWRRLSVITGFIVLFLGLLAFTTVARPFESLAAAAAYSAVLVVFLQIGPGDGWVGNASPGEGVV